MLRLPRRILPFLPAFLLFPAVALNVYSQTPSRVQAIRFWSFGDVTRVAIQTEGEYKLFSDQIENPYRLYFDLTGLLPPRVAHHGVQTIQVGDRLVRQIRVAEVSPGKTRIVFDLEGPVEAVSSQLVNPDRLVIELRPKSGTAPPVSVAHSITGSEKIDLANAPPADVPAVNNAPSSAPVLTASPVTAPPLSAPSLNVDRRSSTLNSLQPSAAPQVPATPAPVLVPGINVATHETPAPVAAASRTKALAAAPATIDSGDRSLVRVFGLKLGKVVIDAGHGGHDTGTIGPDGLMEKDLVLDVALRLGKLISRQLGAEVVYTRSSDVFIPLEQRTQIANNEKADLFISIHANSSPEPAATGVETYYFNFTSDRTAIDLATRENATSASSISDLNDLLHRAVLQTKLEESRDFAQRVQQSLWTASVKMNARSKNRGVRQAPFVVLIGATMPSILAEIGFVSNVHDERLLKRNDQRQKIADALFRGISQYANSLSHTQIARVRQ
ncbi:MAG: N-acetylmuramoyl-L-alanine amidase [Acidobacteriaceae bacterium]|nr:N-acetylmuramoyl-L-alanine amidase [Acidobacteriaceae bacterium]